MNELDPTNDYDLQIAQRELIEAEEELNRAEHALEDAKHALTVMQGRVYYYTYKPKRHDVLNPRVEHHVTQLYTYCMQLGYSFAVHNGKVHFAGKPGEGMVNTGINLEDVPA